MSKRHSGMLLAVFIVFCASCSTLPVNPTPEAPTVTILASAATTLPASPSAAVQYTATPVIATPRMLAPLLSGDQLSPTWSPDGRQIVFVSENVETDQRSLYSVDLVNGKLSRITNQQTHDILPQFSPDGKRILFISQWVNQGTKQIPSTIMVLDFGSGAIRQLSDGTNYIYEAAWSPDGSRIAFVSNQGGKDRLWMMNADGSNPRLLTPDLDGIRSAAWSPNGAHIKVTEWLDGGAYSEIHVIDPGTGSDQLLTDRAINANQAVWSADSRSLYYLSGSSIFTVTQDGKTRKMTLTFPSAINDYSISPDGLDIAYSMGSEEDLDLYVSGIDGSDLRCYGMRVWMMYSPCGRPMARASCLIRSFLTKDRTSCMSFVLTI